MTEALLWLDPALHVLTLVGYGIATTMLLFGVAGVRPAWGERAVALSLAAGVAFHTAGLGARWLAVGHGPYITRYEVLSANAWVALLLWLVASRAHEQARALRVVLVPSVLLIVALGLYTGPEASNLPPTFSGIWLVMHVWFYFVAFAGALGAVSTAVLHLVRGGAHTGWAAGSPDADALDAMGYRAAGLAFAFWGIGMLSGSIWAYYAWGRFWGWDPVETWSLVTWLAFGLYLHLRRFRGWRDARAAWLLLGCFFLAAGTLFFTSLIDGSLHAVYFR